MPPKIIISKIFLLDKTSFIRRNRIKIFWFLAVYSRTYSAVLQISCHNKNILLLKLFVSSFQNRCLFQLPHMLVEGSQDRSTKHALCCSGPKPDWTKACSSQPWWWAARGGNGPLRATSNDWGYLLEFWMQCLRTWHHLCFNVLCGS